MKTLFQILAFIAVVGVFLALFFAGSPSENTDPINRDAYFNRGVQDEIIDFLK